MWALLVPSAEQHRGEPAAAGGGLGIRDNTLRQEGLPLNNWSRVRGTDQLNLWAHHLTDLTIWSLSVNLWADKVNYKLISGSLDYLSRPRSSSPDLRTSGLVSWSLVKWPSYLCVLVTDQWTLNGPIADHLNSWTILIQVGYGSEAPFAGMRTVINELAAENRRFFSPFNTPVKNIKTHLS